MYKNKLILAPMVRLGILPMRLMALKYGADLVFTPELIDKKLIKTSRIQNDVLGTVDFIESDTQKCCLRIHPTEKSKLILQIGTADPVLALQAALKVADDVVGVDVNCGCPKKFSVAGGMGSALLTNANLLVSILTTLVQNLPVPVTCKIRLLPTLEETLVLIEKVQSTGISAISIHTREKHHRPQDPAKPEILSEIIKSKRVHIPIIANGDIFSHVDVCTLKNYGINSFMVARAAQENVSIFQTLKEGGDVLDVREICIEFLKISVDYDMPFHVVKYCLNIFAAPLKNIHVTITQPLFPPANKKQKTSTTTLPSTFVDVEIKLKEALSKAKCMRSMCQAFEIAEYHDQVMEQRKGKEMTGLKGSSEKYFEDASYVPHAPFMPGKNYEE